MAFQKLPKLKQPEPTNVSARVIDVFYQPQVKPVDKTVLLLAQSLDQLQPSLQRYSVAQEEVKEETDAALAQADFNKNRKEFNKLIKDGELPEGASPYYINAYINAELRDKARQFNDELFSAYQNSNVQNDLDPNSFGKFYVKFANTWRENNKLDLYDQVNVAQSFIPYADASRSNLENQHIQGRVSIIETNQKNLLGKRVVDLLDDTLLNNREAIEDSLSDLNISKLSDTDKLTLHASLGISEEMQNLIDNGMNPSTANKVVVDSIIREAIEKGDEDVLNLLKNIRTTGDNRLSDSLYAEEEITKAIDIIEANEREDTKFRIYMDGVEKKERQDNDFNAFLQHLRLGGKPNIQRFINLYTRKDGTKILEADTVDSLTKFAKGWVDGLNFVQENTEVTRDILLDIYQNPNNEQILIDITNGVGRDFDSKKAEELMDAYFKRQAQVDSKYYSSSSYTSKKSALKTFISKGQIEITNEAQDLIDVASNQFDEIVLEIIIDLETNPKYSNFTKLERLQEFNKLTEAEYNRIKNLLKEDQVFVEAQQELKDAITSGADTIAPY